MFGVDSLSDGVDLSCLQADVTSRQDHCRVWFPFRLILSLMTRLRRNHKLAGKYGELQEALQRHQESAMNMSHILQSKFDPLDEVAIMEE